MTAIYVAARYAISFKITTPSFNRPLRACDVGRCEELPVCQAEQIFQLYEDRIRRVSFARLYQAYRFGRKTGLGRHVLT